MGYTLKIGEFVAAFHDEDGKTWIGQDVKDQEYEGAPAFGEPTDRTNSRWPSYTSWLDFTRFVRLEPLMNELLRDHPGCVPLVVRHKRAIDAAMQRMQAAFPGLEPAMSEGFNEGDPRPYLARLTWLSYWVDWALDNCEHPVFYNS